MENKNIIIGAVAFFVIVMAMSAISFALFFFFLFLISLLMGKVYAIHKNEVAKEEKRKKEAIDVELIEHRKPIEYEKIFITNRKE